MGAVQSDLKASIVRASSSAKVISPQDEDYWQIYWSLPETTEHVFETFTATDIRGMRDDAAGWENLRTLLLKVTLQLIRLRSTVHASSDNGKSNGAIVLNCVRLLTRILPFVYESEQSRRWEEATFSASHDLDFYQTYHRDAKQFVDPDNSLTTQLIDTLLDLLFTQGFTLAYQDADSEGQKEAQTSYGLWQSGIACVTTVITSREFESRRTEILRLLLTLESKSVFVGPREYMEYEVQALQRIVQHPDKRRVQSLLCSLLNTIIKYHPDSWLPFDPRTSQGDSSREMHVKACLHFLLVNFLNRAPWDESGGSKNEFRLQFSYLHKPTHFQFLADGIFKILRRPLEASNNLLSLGQKPGGWTPEMILLLWEALYTNRKYLLYVIDSGRALDLMVLLVFYAKESMMEGIGRVCVFCLQTLSAEPRFGAQLNRVFEAHDTLPPSIQIKNFHGTYADYFIMSILALLESSPNENIFWLASLTAIISNTAPSVVRLGRATSTKLLQQFGKYSKPSFLLANEGNLLPLANLLYAINSIIERHDKGHENDAVLYATWRSRGRFNGLREMSLMDEDSIASTAFPISSAELGGEGSSTDKAQGKRPSEYKSSSAEFMRKVADLPLHTPLALIAFLESQQSASPVKEPSADASGLLSARTSLTEGRPSHDGTSSATEILRPLRELGRVPGVEEQPVVTEGFRFQPSIAALSASYYWGLVVSHDAQRVSGRGTGIWTGTEIRLFRIQQAGSVQGPSLWSPKGAVDAVGESLVAGVMDLTMRAKKGISGE